MLLDSKDGIQCDGCGTVLRDKFDYYSINCARVKVDCDRAETSPVQVDDDILDFDICTECHKKRIDEMKSTRS